MLRRLRARRPSVSAVAAVLVLVVVVVLVVAWSGGSVEVETGAEVSRGLTAADLRAVEIGSSRDDVQRAIGEGESALQDPVFGTTRTALEPMDAMCLYYWYAGRQNVTDLAQLCYRDDRLVSKRVYR